MTWSILLTVDYELFGDGTGSITDQMIRPLDSLLHLWDELGVRATIFVEVAELLAFQREIRAGRSPGSLKAEMEAVRAQLSEALKRGHDLQLHLHPQWHEAVLRDGGWRFNDPHYSLLRLGRDKLSRLVTEAKLFLTELAFDIMPDYECRAFRAGAFHYDRQASLGRLLSGQGIRLDSSVCRGYYRSTDHAQIDYRDLLEVRDPYWPSLDGARSDQSEESLWEVPIWSVMKPQWKKLTPRRVGNKLSSLMRGSRAGGQFSQMGLSLSAPGNWLGWLRREQPIMWDYCNLSGRGLIRHFKRGLQFHAPRPPRPLVMIGHTKDFRSGEPLRQLAAELPSLADVQWLTMNELVDLLDAEGRPGVGS